MKKDSKRIQKKNPSIIGMKPLLDYLEIDKEEKRELRKMTRKDARIQTEALLRAAKWFVPNQKTKNKNSKTQNSKPKT